MTWSYLKGVGRRVDLTFGLNWGCDDLFSESFHAHVEEKNNKYDDDCARKEASHCGWVLRLAVVSYEAGVREEIGFPEEVVDVVADRRHFDVGYILLRKENCDKWRLFILNSAQR